ncbi:MAG TPA: hypothetical protein VKT22_01670 [Steroidobacteraceae bacterium]|nr:hypothetical protein [Steroidobacteraceae bacterium]
MRRIARPADPGRSAAQCMVWLPGAYQALEDFLEAGFDTAVRERRLPLDLEFVDLEPEHLNDRTALERLESAVLAPARARGARCLWLAGISLGGYIALETIVANPRACDGLCLLAPYLGQRSLIAEIASAGRLEQWSCGSLAQADEERGIWRFVQAGGLAKRCLLGFGSEDRYAAGHRLLAATLPAEAVQVIAGGHDWATWRRLWELLLDSRFR